MRKILGVDPGLKGGLSVIDERFNFIASIPMPVKTAADGSDRIDSRPIYDFIEEYKPDCVALEAPFYGKNIQVMLKLGRAQGVAMAAALSRDIPIYEYSPRKIKQSVTGNGSASKEQVAGMLQNLLNLKEFPTKYLDASDGLAVAVCHHFNCGSLGVEKSYSGWASFLKQNPDRLK